MAVSRQSMTTSAAPLRCTSTCRVPIGLSTEDTSELYSIPSEDSRAFVVHPHPSLTQASEPEFFVPRTTLGGEGPYSRRPWKQECFDKQGPSRIVDVAVERAWVAITGLTPLPPQKRSNVADCCYLPGFSCGCFVRCRPCNVDSDTARERNFP
ncbi:hypothetical protein Emed_000962 [Eimeria media]